MTQPGSPKHTGSKNGWDGPSWTSAGKEIFWNFQGKIHISFFDKPHEIMYMQGEQYDSDIEGVGYHFHIRKDNMVNIEKSVYRKSLNQNSKWSSGFRA